MPANRIDALVSLLITLALGFIVGRAIFSI